MAALPMLFLYLAVISAAVALPASAQLTPNFYDEICPLALPTIETFVELAIGDEPRMGASLLRLHFHDCIVNGCDGSILLDDTSTLTGEKTAPPNLNSIRGFDVVDHIKSALDEVCSGNIVSCADILAVAARDSVAALGGPSYEVLLGRRDSTSASKDDATNNIPSPFSDLSVLVSNFISHGLSLEDLVILSGAHTLGFAKCSLIRNRIFNDTDIDKDYAASLQHLCSSSGEDNNLASFDGSPDNFDNVYFKDLLQEKGLFHSDQQLFKGDGSASDDLVRYYSEKPDAFWSDFGASMIKLGSISPLTGTNGEIRMDCRKVN